MSRPIAEPDPSETPVDLSLFESSPDCIKILDPDGTIRHLSPGGKIALELDSVDQLDGAAWPSLWPGSEQARVQHAVAEGRNGNRMQFLAFCRTAKNTPRWWDVALTPMLDSSSSVSGLLVVSRDVTELVQAKQALAEANQRKDDFMATLSHELRNPLSALEMAAQVLDRVHGELPQVARISELIVRQVGHMSRLTEDLLDVSRIVRGQVSLQSASFDLRDSLHDSIEQLTAMLATRNQVLHTTLPAAPVWIEGDRMRMAQVLGNLLGNASRYSPPESSIQVSLAVDAGLAVVTVADQGQGISANMIPTLFDMYSRAQATADRTASGVGMGLSIVKGLVQLHGGSVSVESEGSGKGSTFVVTLPLAAAGADGVR